MTDAERIQRLKIGIAQSGTDSEGRTVTVWPGSPYRITQGGVLLAVRDLPEDALAYAKRVIAPRA